MPDGPILADLVVTVDQAAVGQPTTGQVRVQGDAVESAKIPEQGIWDLQLTDGTDDFVKTVFAGPTLFTLDVTV